uniref:Uncharacterized protein n=1 Tax=Cucumis melo TaxID=3656 RepID=A0A9I9EKU4_CUCME
MSLHKVQSSKQPCRTSKLRGHDYVIELLNGNDNQYYLVNSGSSNIQGFLTLFRGQRYHLRDLEKGDIALEVKKKCLTIDILHCEMSSNVILVC